MKNTKRYHYTTECSIPKILVSMKILKSEIYLEKNEKPVTWVSSNPFWENTVTKMIYNDSGSIQLTFDEQVHLLGCARIEIKPSNLIPWKSLKHQAKISPEMAAALVKEGKKLGGNPDEWYGSLSDIGIDQWIKIEVYRNGKWIEPKKY